MLSNRAIFVGLLITLFWIAAMREPISAQQPREGRQAHARPDSLTSARAQPTRGVVDSWLYGADIGTGDGSSTLFRIGTTAAGGVVPLEVIGETGFDEIFDIAFAGGRLYGITSFDDLIEIDLSTGAGSLVGDVGNFGTLNALGPRDTASLIAATNSGDVYHIFVVGASATEVGGFGAGQESSGDLARDASGRLFGVDDADGFGESDILLDVHPDTGFAIPIGPIGFEEVWGLAVDPRTDILYGVVDTEAENKLVTINKVTGTATIVGIIPTTNPIGGLAAAPMPAADTLSFIDGLIVPGFEVDLSDPNGPTTLFAVRNTSDDPRNIKVHYYPFGVRDAPLRTDTIQLNPHENAPINVGLDVNNLFVESGIATGLIVITNEAGGSAGLEGDYFRIDFSNDFATGDRMVRSSEFCKVMEIRYVDFGGGTRFRVLLDDPPTDASPAFSYIAYSGDGSTVAQGDFFTSDHLVFIDQEDLVPGQSFGTLVLDLESSSGGWASAEYSAFGRFSLELNSACVE